MSFQRPFSRRNSSVTRGVIDEGSGLPATRSEARSSTLGVMIPGIPTSKHCSFALFGFLLGAACHAEIVIPIELEKGNPIAAAQINGIPVRLVIDSGGEAISLKPGTLRKIEATPSGAVKPGTNAVGETNVQSLFKIETLVLGGKPFAHLEAVEAGAYAADSPGDGVIGRDFLNQYVVVYDYPARTIRLFPPRERRSAAKMCTGNGVRSIPDAERIIVSMAATDHVHMRLLWDTGAQYSFVKRSFAEEHQLPVEHPFYSSHSFVLDGHDFGPMKFVVIDAVAPANVDGYLGSNFFETHIVCIDARRQSIRIRG
jgi:hypothetical protein